MNKPKETKNKKLASSFRDPSGFIFCKNEIIYRQINQRYAKDFDFLISSNLYSELTKAKLLISHTVEKEIISPDPKNAYLVIKPEHINFISYPYEWSFSQLKDAALLTLKIQKKALSKGMSLKDASAYNIQFKNGNPVLIDTLSFEKYIEGSPWIAYRQFCQHFLGPLLLMAHTDIRLSNLLRNYIDGIPLELIAKLLPIHKRLSFSTLIHIFFHAKAQKNFADKVVKAKRKISKIGLLGIIENLESLTKKTRWKPADTEWGNYYSNTNYSETAISNKEKIVDQYLESISPAPKSVWDLGANDGRFSRISAKKLIPTIAFDIDPVAIEKGYLSTKQRREKNLLPLLQDFTNPSPNIGWANKERDSVRKRGPADMLFALAIIHHLAISNNLPFSLIAEYFASLGKHLIIEFVPKSDSKVQHLLKTREDIFNNYDQEHFEKEFTKYFDILKSTKVKDSARTIYLMKTNIFHESF